MQEDVRTLTGGAGGEAALLEPLGEIWCRVFRVPEADPDAVPADLGNRSLAVIELMVAVQQRWGVALPMDVMLTDVTLRRVARMVHELGSEQRP
jgi:acyl carrier protein